MLLRGPTALLTSPFPFVAARPNTAFEDEPEIAPERLEAIEGRLGAITGSLPDRMASIEERVLRQNEERADELSRQLTGLASRLEQGDQRLAGMAAELAGIRDGIGARSQSTDLKLVRLGERLNALEDALSDLEQRTIVVEESQRLIAVG